MFLGEYRLQFSGQGRVILPRKLRVNLAGEKILVLSRGMDGCIWGFTREGFEKEAQKQLDASIAEEKARFIRRYLFSASELVELDAQARFVISKALLEYAKIEDEVVIIGAGDHFEIWDPRTWQRHIKAIEEGYGRA